MKIHTSLRVTLTMAAGVTDRLWSLEDVVGLIDAAAPKPEPPKRYRERPKPFDRAQGHTKQKNR